MVTAGEWMMPEPDEERLVEQARAGDREAFLRLVEPYRQRVHATACRLLGNEEDALEVTQEVVLRTFWNIRRFHGRAHFYTWAYRTALNLCYRRLSDSHAEISRRSVSVDSRFGPGEEEPPGGSQVPARAPSPREEASAREEIELVRRALGRLQPKDFQILVLREFEELSYEEIGTRLKISPASVPSRLHRARAALARRLKELGIE